MKKHFLFIVLVGPLMVGAAVFMLAGFLVTEPWRSLLVNVAAGLLGSIVTVFYVDRILRRNERYEWTKVINHVGRQVNILANATTSSFRLALHVPMVPSPEDYELANDPRHIRAKMVRLIEDQLLPRMAQFSQMNQDEWRKFANNMVASVQNAERILTLFSRNLEPTIMGLILDIHEKASAVLSYYQTWPDRLGIPFDHLKPNNSGESMVPYFRLVYKLATQDAEQLLTICANLLREIDARFP